MRVLCSYYVNAKRLSLVLEKLSLRPDISIFAVKGTFVRTPTAIRCLGREMEFLVVSKVGADAILLTSRERYRTHNKELIDYEVKCRDNIYIQALNLCLDKTAVSGNTFQMDCALDGCTIEATSTPNGATYKLKAPKGDCLLEESSIPDQVYSECRGIRAFRYSVVTNTSEKEVTVRKGQLEVFKEIAHYVNKALLFTKLEDGRVSREYCITPTGCCELVEKGGKLRLVKVPFTKLTIDTSCALTAMDISLDVLLRSASFSQALAGGVTAC